MGKWDSQTLLGGSGVDVADLMLISDQSQAEGSQDRNITVGEASLAGHQFLVSQTSHGLSVGDCVRWNGSAYVEAVATTGENALFNGVIVQVIDANSYVIKHDGFAYGFSGLTPGSKYYLQDSGGLGTSAGTVEMPVLLAVTATSGWLLTPVTPASSVTYEAGTFTPAYGDGVSTTTTGAGRYIKIGDMVSATGRVVNCSRTGLTLANDVYISGLPFSSVNVSTYIAIGGIVVADVSFSGQLVAHMSFSTSRLRIGRIANSTFVDYITVGSVDDGIGDIWFDIKYHVA